MYVFQGKVEGREETTALSFLSFLNPEIRKTLSVVINVSSRVILLDLESSLYKKLFDFEKVT